MAVAVPTTGRPEPNLSVSARRMAAGLVPPQKRDQPATLIRRHLVLRDDSLNGRRLVRRIINDADELRYNCGAECRAGKRVLRRFR